MNATTSPLRDPAWFGLPRDNLQQHLTSLALPLVSWFFIHLVIGTIIFDFVHWGAHVGQKSSYRVFRWLYDVHATHHYFFNRRLRFNDQYRKANMVSHLPLELTCQAFGSWVSWLARNRAGWAKKLGSLDLVAIMIFLVIRVLVVEVNEGEDSNHLAYDNLPKDNNLVIVGPEYHVLHHIDPDNYFGSMVRLIDVILGRAATIKRRHIAIVGADTPFGQALTTQLVNAGARSVTPLPLTSPSESTPDSASTTAFSTLLSNTDILILADPAPQATQNNTLISLFRTARFPSADRPSVALHPEIWAVGSPSFDAHAREYMRDPNCIYRHITPLPPARDDAKVANDVVWWITRGARYVPSTNLSLKGLGEYCRFSWSRQRVSGKEVGGGKKEI